MILDLLALGADVAVAATLPGDQTFTTSTADPTDAVCGIQINADGILYLRAGASPSVYAFYSTWLTGAGTAADYQVYVTDNNGNIAGQTVDGVLNSTTGSWLSCSTTRRWAVSYTGSSGTTTGSVTIQIRSALDGRVLDTGTFTLVATVS